MKDYLPEEIKARNQTFENNFETSFEFISILPPNSTQSVICRGVMISIDWASTVPSIA